MSMHPFRSFDPFKRAADAVGGGGFNPSSLSPAAWFSDTGADTSEWLDISGNGFHLTQATAGSRPTIDAAAQNGLQARGFATGRSIFRNAVIGTTDYSFAMVFNTPASGSTQTYLRNGAGSTGVRYDRRASPGNQGNVAHSGVGDVVNVVTPSTWKIVVATRKAGTPHRNNVFVDGVNVALNTTTNMNNPATSFTLGGSNCAGQIGEALAWDRELTTGEVADLTLWLNAKWLVY